MFIKIEHVFMKKINFKRGFTLIELLVVVAIIGILASVVLASLNSSRKKTKDARAKKEMVSMITSAELYYSSCYNRYNNNAGFAVAVTMAPLPTATTGCANSSIFSDTQSNTRNLLLALQGDATAISGYVTAPGDAWSVAATLPTGGFYCVDSTGYSGGNLKGTTTAYSALSGSPSVPNPNAAHLYSLSSFCN